MLREEEGEEEKSAIARKVVARTEERRERKEEEMQERRDVMAIGGEGKKRRGEDKKERNVKGGWSSTKDVRPERRKVHGKKKKIIFCSLLFFGMYPYLEGFHVVGNYSLLHKRVGVLPWYTHTHILAPVQAGTEMIRTG